MVEPQLASSSPNVLLHTTHPSNSLPTDDDDEPPCSGSSPSHPPPALIIDSGPDVYASANPSEKHLPRRRNTIVANAISPGNTGAQIVEVTPISRLRTLFTPTHQLGPSPGYLSSFKSALLYSPLNVFLLFVPISWALHWTHQSDTAIFVVSALAIVPLAALLGLGTEQIALRTSQAVGGLLNATLGNVVELIIAGIALGRCDLQLVQSSLLGGLLSNLLLVLGMAFVVGGFRFHSQEFQPMAAQLNSSLLTVSVIALVLPAAFHEWLDDRLAGGDEGPLLLRLSRASAVVLIAIYLAYLVFQFYSHNHLFIDTIQPLSSSSKSSLRTSRTSSIESTSTTRVPSASILPLTINDVEIHDFASTSTSSYDTIYYPRMNMISASILLAAVTALTYVTSENLVDSINGLVENSGVNKQWITLIIIPIISNAAEHTTAVVVATKGKFDLAMGVAVGSCIQIALFIIPVLVLVAWGLGKPLTLFFDPLETLCLFLSVLVVKFAIEDGKAHWMSGTALISVYVLIAICFWFYPEGSNEVAGLVCT